MVRRLLIVLALSLSAWPTWASPSQPAETSEPQNARLLLIALDAVPFSTMERVAKTDSFQTFKGPVPLISTFPSTTSLALAGILESFGLEKSPGYEHRYFDPGLNRIQGGGLFSYSKHLFPWRKFFDWQSDGLFKKGLLLLRPQKAGKKSLSASLAAFAASDEPVFTIYHDLTDLIGHVKGPEKLEPLLHHLAAALRELEQQEGIAPFQTVIYSDHGLAGGEPLRNVRRSIRRALRRKGARIVKRLRRPEDVVFIPYGLVSSFVAFTTPGHEVYVAKTLVQVEGVDLCVARESEGWQVLSDSSSARILRRDISGETRFSYQPLAGDPLLYTELIEGSDRTTAKLSSDGSEVDEAAREISSWRSDAWWFETTKHAQYPDALYRIAQGFDLVANPASIICSIAGGHMYGAAYTVFGSRVSTGKLRWTHGALGREASLGFVMSDLPGWRTPEVARFDNALPSGASRD